MQPTRWRLAFLIVLALLVAACGRGGEEADDGVPVETEGTEVDDEDAPTSDVESVTYEVEEGDTLSGIAAQHGVTVEAIVAANDLDDPDRIFPGDVLEIPHGSEAVSDEPDADRDDTDGARADEEGAGVGEE